MRALVEPLTESYNQLPAALAMVTSSPADADVNQSDKVALYNTRFIVQKVLCPLVVAFGVVGKQCVS
jgi:hypothetical protein